MKVRSESEFTEGLFIVAQITELGSWASRIGPISDRPPSPVRRPRTASSRQVSSARVVRSQLSSARTVTCRSSGYFPTGIVVYNTYTHTTKFTRLQVLSHQAQHMNGRFLIPGTRTTKNFQKPEAITRVPQVSSPDTWKLGGRMLGKYRSPTI